MAEEGKALQLANWIIDKSVGGFGPFVSAPDLADEYLADETYKDNNERAWSLIKWESSKNATTGFSTGLGGFATLPVTIPADLGATWLIQARLAASIAHLHGHDVQKDKVRTLVLMSMLGDAGLKEPLKVAGVSIAEKSLQSAIKSLSKDVITKINQAIGYRLLTKAGEKGVINLTKLVPIAGGIIAGAVDGITCYAVGSAAQNIFAPATGKPDPEPSTSA